MAAMFHVPIHEQRAVGFPVHSAQSISAAISSCAVVTGKGLDSDEGVIAMQVTQKRQARLAYLHLQMRLVA